VTNPIRATAVPRQDGSDQDGVHIMWSAPDEAGFSVHGFDIQRRNSQTKFEEICYTLTTADFVTLNSELRVDLPYGRMSLREARCPRLPADVPDEPHKPEAGRICVSFKSMPRGKFPNPRKEQGLSFKVHSSARDPSLSDREANSFTLHQELDQYHGLWGGVRMEISLEKPSDYVALECYISRGPSKISIYDDAGKLLDIRKYDEGSPMPQWHYFHHASIQHVVVDVPRNRWLLLSACFHSAKGSCTKFIQSGAYPNPYPNMGYVLEVYSRNGRKLKVNKVVQAKKFIGLDTSARVHITPRAPVESMKLSFVHFSTSPEIEMLDRNGKVLDKIQPYAEKGREFSVTLKAETAFAGVRLKSPGGETLLLAVCPVINVEKSHTKETVTHTDTYLTDAARATPVFDAPAVMMRSKAGLKTRDVCRLYTVNFRRMHPLVRLKAGYGAYLLVAFSQGKAVRTELIPASATPILISLENKFIDKLHIYMKVELKYLRICLDEDRSFEEDEKEWSSVPFLVKGLQLPFKTFNPSLGNDNDEENLAQSRVLGAEVLDTVAFRKMADLMNTTGKDLDRVTPMEFFTRTKERVKDPPIDIHTWPYGISTILKPAWRRALGFGFLDRDSNLTTGNAYDYRISGYFRRRDLEEKLLSFRTIPLGLLLPRQFNMGGITLTTTKGVKVSNFPDIPETALQKTARKGIRIESVNFGGYSLKLSLAEPIKDIVLELEPSAMNNFRYEAQSSSFFPGLGSMFADPLPQQERVHISFPDPVSEINFFGSALIYGFRLNPIHTGEDPNKIVKKSVNLYHVVYQDSPKPVAPSFLGTTNLQQPAIVGEPELIVANPRDDMGFRISWIPPLNGTTPISIWPEDLAAFPPFDALGFHLERRRVDVPEDFIPIDGVKSDTLFMGSRDGPSDPLPVTFGADILELFPLVRPPTPPIEIFMEAQDVLIGSATELGVPGGLYQYRIFAVDVLDRKSATPTKGSVVRLEKRVAPPQPGAPNLPANGDVGFAGVRASVLQASDPELSSADQSLLGSSSNAVVLDWGWSQEQRQMDPFAREFRVYWQSVVPDQIFGSVTGPPVLSGSYYDMPATLQQSVSANLYSGRYVSFGDYPFKIKSHSAGSNINIKLEKSAADPSRVPQQTDFVLSASLSGEDVRPTNWQKRHAVIPITAQENYQYIFRDVLTLNAANPKERIWVGVSAADDQYYISDELPSSATNGNRPGNESSIAVGYAQARFYGRPVFTVPPPLEDVPEIPTEEPATTSVELDLDLPAIYGTGLMVPAGHRIVLEQIPSAVLLNMIGATPSDQIEANLPDGTNPIYTLSNPGDHSTFLAQIRDGVSQAIEGKFIMNFLIRFKSELDELWTRVITSPVAYGTHKVTLKADPERYFYQIRLADAAGHISEAGAIMPRIVRTRSIRVPEAPALVAKSSNNDQIQVKAEFRDQFDLMWLILFVNESEITTPPDEATLKKAQALRLPNRMDLYPDDGIRIRLRDGSMLEPVFSGLVSAATLDGDIRKMEMDITLNLDKRVALWALLMSRDGIASRAMGPIMVTTGPELPVAPIPSFVRNGNRDDLSWLAPAIDCRVRVQRNIDGSWKDVSPWLSEGITSYSVKSPAVDRSYQLSLKASRGPEVTGNALTINEP
jgi:hypothetical protein